MTKILRMGGRPKARHKKPRKLEAIKEELLKYHGIDLDRLIAAEPASTLTLEEFETLTDRILESIDHFCEEHPSATVHDVLYTLENVKEIIKDTVDPD
jgi:hypothetical protein